MKRSPRFLSAALAVVLASSLFGIPAYAVDADTDDAIPTPQESQEPAADPAAPEVPSDTPAVVENNTLPPNADQPKNEASSDPVGSIRLALIEGRTAIVDSTTGISAGYTVSIDGAMASIAPRRAIPLRRTCKAPSASTAWPTAPTSSR